MRKQRNRIVHLDALDERLKEEVLQDRIDGVRDEIVGGLSPARWGQVALLFHGETGSDALYCLSRGLTIPAAAAYLHTSERTIKNTAQRFLAKLQAMKDGVSCTHSTQAPMFDLSASADIDDFFFTPAPRAPTRRGRPRKTAEIMEPQQLEMDMCY